MPTTSEHEFRQALLELYRPGLNLDSFSLRATQLLRAVISCDGCTYSELDPVAKSITVNFDYETPRAALGVQGYVQHMMHYDFTNFDPNVAGGRPFMRSDYVSHRQFRNSGVYSDGFRLVDINDHGAIPITSPDGKILFVGIERLERGVFRGHEGAIMRDLQPFLCSARALAVANSMLLPVAAEAGTFCRYGLTPREADVLFWMVQGKSNPEIAAILSLSALTVRDYTSQIFNKLNVENRYLAILKGLDLLRLEAAGKTNTLPGATVPLRSRIR